MSFHTMQNRKPLKPQVSFDNMDDVNKAKLKFLGLYISLKNKNVTSRWGCYVFNP